MGYIKQIEKKERKIREKAEDRLLKIEYKRNIKEIPSQLPKYLKEKEVIRREETYEQSKDKLSLQRLKKEKVRGALGAISKALSKPFLKKPKVSVPKYSAVKAVSQIARQQGALVREVPPRNLVPDNRSLYFNDEFVNEKRNMMRWMGGN